MSSGVDRWPSRLDWLLFVAQVLLVEIFDAGNDIIRGDLFPPSPRDAIVHALQVIHFESVHGFFVEPDWYRFSQQTHHLLGVTLASNVTVGIANNVYAFFHIGVPILVAAWVYVWHRNRFGLLRNVLIITGIVALVGYFVFPVAPPRLTTEIVFHGHAFQFHDTMPYPKSTVLINGRPFGYNPYAAMPSLHIAWATTIATMMFLLTRNPMVRVFALCYPAIMTLATVVTANHYIMDAVGGVMAVCVAGPIAVGFTWLLRTRSPSG